MAAEPLKLLPTVVDAGPGAIARQITINAPREMVFSYFTDPAKHVRWQGKTVDIDPRPGGRLRIDFGPGWTVVGRYLEVDPPRRLVYTWGWAEEGSSLVPPGSSTVEVELEAIGDATVVRVVHNGLPEESFSFHGDGWDEGLTGLRAALATLAAGS